MTVEPLHSPRAKIRHLAAALRVGLMLVVATGIAVADAAGAAAPPHGASLDAQCPEFAAWRSTHQHPMPGALKLSPGERIANQAMAIRLIDMSNAEQSAMADFGGQPPGPGHKDRWAKLQSIQAHNLATMKAIVAENGFPTIGEVGTAGAWAAWDLVQHADSDHAFQQHVLALAGPLAARKEVPGEAYAYLVDRVRVAEGRAQIYGTQLHLVGDELVMRPVEDPSRLDALRGQTDMPSEAAYLCYVSYRSGKKTRM